MSATAPDKNLFVDDVVTALTGDVDPRGDARLALKNQMQRATEEFDNRTAEAFARALLESLCKEPLDLRRLEALLILGLAHPTILERHRISLDTEGRRLALMLEHEGQPERARVLLDVIEGREPVGGDDKQAKAAVPPPVQEIEKQIEALLAKAESCASRGRTQQAIRWLQEVVALDRNRRDVARMIRDLRFQEKEQKARLLQRTKIAAMLLVAGGAIWFVVKREQTIQARYHDMPSADSGAATDMRARLEAIDSILSDNKAWFGMATALTEQRHLRRDLERLEATQARADYEAALEKKRKEDLCELSRTRGLELAKEGEYKAALTDLREALQLSDTGWQHRVSVQSNIDAIEKYLAQSH